MSAQQVGVPSTNRRPFVACVRNHPNAEGRVIRWKARMTGMSVHPVTLGEFVDHKGSYCLNRKQGEQIFSFEDPILWLIRGHILGEKPAPSGDVNPIRPMNVHSRMFRNFTSQTSPGSRLVWKAASSHPHLAGVPLQPYSSTPLRRDDANCSNLSPCHGRTTESSHNFTGLGTGRLGM